MSRRVRLLLSISALLATVLGSNEARAATLTRRIAEGNGPSVVIRARDFTPGDILLLTLEGASGLREADVAWRGRDYKLETSRESGHPLALIGIDFALKPGDYPIRVTFSDKAGRTRTVEDRVEVKPRQFRVRRLVLDEKFVVAPPEQLERIQREREMVAAAYRASSPDWLGDGLFELPHQGLMYPNFGDRRLYNGRPGQSHSGVDISAEMGDPILASNSGKVVLAADLYFSGNTVIIDHGLGVFTCYFHMSKLLVRTGVRVPKGRVLGEAGSTGRSTGPHLHWGVTIFDSRVDPRALLRLPLLDWERRVRTGAPAEPESEEAPPTSAGRAAKAPAALATRTAAPPAVQAKAAAGKVADQAKGRYYIQLAAFDKRAAADSFASRIRAAGYPTLVLKPEPADKKSWYRVRVGGYASKDDAEKVVLELRGVVTGRKFEYWIIRD